MKFYRFQCSNGLVFEVPLGVIIRNKAIYALNQKWYPEMPLNKYYDIVEAEMKRDYEEIEEWARNNMDWDDVKEFAKLVPSEEKKMNMQEEWCNPNETKIVEHD